MLSPQFFKAFGAKQSEILTWPKLLELVTSGTNLVYRNTMDSRKARADGNDKLAAELKAACGMITPCSHCTGDRKSQNLKCLTMVGMVDIDHIPAEAMAEALQKVKADRHTTFCHVTNSQQGIRILFAYQVVNDEGEVLPDETFAFGSVPDETHDDFVRRIDPYYRAAWEAGSRYFATLAGWPSDKSCKDAVRVSFLCHDPEAYLNEQAEPLTVAVSEVRSFAQQPHRPTPTSQVHAAPVMKDQLLKARVMEGLNLRVDEALIRGLMEVHPYQPSGRHMFWVKLGFKLKAFGHSIYEVEAYKTAALRLLADAGLLLPDDPSQRLPHEVEDAMQYGFDHGREGDEDWVRQYQVRNGFRTVDAFGSPASLTTQNSDPSTPDAEETDEDIIRLECPHFPESVYMNLPEQLHRALKPVTEAVEQGEMPQRRQDTLLLGLTANYSALCPEVELEYGTHTYTPNIAFAALSQAGNGKGVLTYAFRIVERVDAFLEQESAREHREWHERNDAYQLAMQDKKLSRDEKEALERPGDEPQDRLLVMPGTTSRSQFTLCMNAMGRDGLIINSTEIQTVSATLKLDVGDFSDLLCKAISNERIDQFFKCDAHRIKVERPKLSVCLSGTFDQFHNFIPDYENGLFSRFCYLMMEPHVQWIPQQPSPNYDAYEAEYRALADDAFRMWQMLQQCPTKVRFTDSQWEQHALTWRDELDGLVFEGGQDRLSVVNRHGLLHMRIASVLTVLRKWNEYKRLEDSVAPRNDRERQRMTELFAAEHTCMLCRDDDFETARQMTVVLLKHALHLSTTIAQHPNRKVQDMRRWPWTVRCACEMTEVFQSEDFVKRGEKQYGRSRRQVFQALRNMVKNGYLVKVNRGMYCKGDLLKKVEGGAKMH